MELNGHKRHATLNFVIMAIFMAAILAGLAVLTWLEINAANAAADNNLKKALMRMAWLTISLGGLILILFAWMAIRQIRYRFTLAITKGSKTEYQDAWAMAGKRLKVDDRDGEPDQPAEPDDGRDGNGGEKGGTAG